MLSMIMATAGEPQNTGPEAFFGFMGVACALVFANLGAAYGTAKSGVGVCSMGVLKPDLIIKSVIPVVMAGILGIYGLIVAIILIQKSKVYFKN
jgi:V-type H+-transporting ATPase proteolipid subunit